MNSSIDLQARLDQAVMFAREAGSHTLKYFQRADVGFERKGDASPVTIADREAEALLRERLRAAFPGDGVLGEELGEVPGTSGYRWILDPIDGTKSFIFGVPLYTTLVGLEYEGRGVLGVVVAPGLDECVYGALGHGAWHVRGNAAPQPARVSSRSSLSQGLFLTCQVDNFHKRGAGEAFHELERSAYVTRTWGDGYGYLLVATGRAEAMVDPLMNLWDCAALQPVIEEAGGRFTNWAGVATIHGGDAIGSNGLVHEEVLAATKRFAK